MSLRRESSKSTRSVAGKFLIPGLVPSSANSRIQLYLACQPLISLFNCYAVLRGVRLSVCFLAGLFAANAANGAQIALQWDANAEVDLAGYRIYCGITSHNYTVIVDMGNVTSCVVSGLSVGRTYYFAVTAYDTEGLESAFSTELPVEIENEPSPCECDLNIDGSCDILDWRPFIEDWTRAACNDTGVDCECDVDEDGVCNILDYQIFMQDWGRTDCPLVP